jgi:hypothetical protein
MAARTPLAAALDYVLPPAAGHAGGASPDDEVLAAANFRLFDLNAEARDALARQQRAGPGRSPRGRVGPPAAAVDLASATPFLTVAGPADGSSLAPLTLESAQGFSSCRANVAVVSGKWQYEVRTVGDGGGAWGRAGQRARLTTACGLSL